MCRNQTARAHMVLVRSVDSLLSMLDQVHVLQGSSQKYVPTVPREFTKFVRWVFPCLDIGWEPFEMRSYFYLQSCVGASFLTGLLFKNLV